MAEQVSAFTDDALGRADAVGLRARLTLGEVTGEELVDAAIARAAQVQPVLNALAYDGADAARLNASADRPGFFAGIPSVVKDNIDLAGQPTGHGTAAFTADRAGKHSVVATLLLRTGLVPIGKSRLPEFGFNASTEYADGPPVVNPWDTAYSAGASSGGSAALVASGVVPIAHANDGGGSIRIPAAACGLVGLKPTRGRLPADTVARVAPVRILYDGVLTRSVRDTAAFFREAGRLAPSRRLPPIGDVGGPSARRLRIGLMETSLVASVDQETSAELHRVADLIEGLGHHVTPFEMPVDAQFADDFSLYWGMLGFVVARGGRRLLHPEFDPERLDNLTRGLAEMFAAGRRELPGAVRRLRRLRGLWRRACSDVDVVLSPTLGHTTPRLGHISPTEPFEVHFDRLRHYVAFTPLQNVTGDPAVSLPLGRTSAGLPMGMHFWAGPGDEQTLLELAYELEAAAPWPSLADIAGSIPSQA